MVFFWRKIKGTRAPHARDVFFFSEKERFLGERFGRGEREREREREREESDDDTKRKGGIVSQNKNNLRTTNQRGGKVKGMEWGK